MADAGDTDDYTEVFSTTVTIPVKELRRALAERKRREDAGQSGQKSTRRADDSINFRHSR